MPTTIPKVVMTVGPKVNTNVTKAIRRGITFGRLRNRNPAVIYLNENQFLEMYKESGVVFTYRADAPQTGTIFGIPFEVK